MGTQKDNLYPEFIDIAVIIPFYNDAERLSLCIEALQNQSVTLPYHIYAVDNGSVTVPWELAEHLSNVTILQETASGSYNARNKALNSVSAKYYAFTDADCIPDGRWLEEAITSIHLNNADAVGGAVYIFCESDNRPTAIEIIDLLKAFPQQTYIENHNFAVTANLVTTADAFKLVGYFDKSLKSGGDKDWCVRLCNAGGKLIYASDAKIGHPARSSVTEHKTKIRRVVHGAFAQRAKHMDMAKLVGFEDICRGLLPPVKKTKIIWERFSSLPTSTRLKSIALYWFLNIYASWEKIKCHLGLVKEAERR